MPYCIRLNQEANSPYELTVCIGAAQVKDTASLKDVIEEADARLYDQKGSTHERVQ